MNISTIGLLTGAHGLLFSLALILSGWPQKQIRFALGIILFVCSIELINAGVIPSGYHSQADAIPFWIPGSYLWLPPALILLLKTLIAPGYKPSKYFKWLFLPVAIEILTETASFISYKLTGKGWELASHLSWNIFTEFVPLVWTLTILFQHVIYMIRTWQHSQLLPVQRHRHQAFSMLFLIITLLWLLDAFLPVSVFPVLQALLCITLCGLGYIIYFRPAFFEPPVPVEVESQPVRTTLPNYAQYDDKMEWERLQELFQTNRLHQQPRLSLDEVAGQLKLPARYLSGLINQQAQTNFNHFVNTWRVQEVLQRMQDPEEHNKTLLGIALDAGFNSKSSFNHIFKSVTGETPSACLKRLREQK